MIYTCRDNPRIRVKEKVAIVLLSYNSRAYLEQFLPFVIQTRYPDYRLIIVDNASTDDTAAFLAEHYPQVDVIRIDVNRGFTNGFVESLPCIEAEYYALLTSDVELPPDWLDPLVKAMDADPGLGACQPKIKAFRERDAFEYAGAAGGYLDLFCYPFCRGRIFDHVEKDKGQYDRPAEIFWASGAVFLLRADLYHRVGGFDNDFFAHMEEIDLCWRIRRAGYSIRVIPESVAYHIGGSVILYGSREKVYHNYRNNLIMLTKNLPTASLILILPLRLLLDLVSGLYALLSGHSGDCSAMFQAHRDYWRLWRKWRDKRYFEESEIPWRRMKGVYRKSVVWQFFVRGIKTFSELPAIGRAGEQESTP